MRPGWGVVRARGTESQGLTLRAGGAGITSPALVVHSASPLLPPLVCIHHVPWRGVGRGDALMGTGR